MDSLTQAVLGAGITGAIAPSGHRRKALLLGAALGTLPDLDVFIDYGGAVENFTMHRGFSHSLFVLAPFALLLWGLLWKSWPPVRKAPLRWLAAVGLALLTHPLLDAHTAYGTQLLWPLDVPPTMWATLFIIDPLFTLPLLVATVFTAFRPSMDWSTPLLRGALAVSLVYVSWTWFAQAKVHREALGELADMGIAEAPVFITPTPFNSVLWRVVVRTDTGYLEGFGSVMPGAPPLTLEAYVSDQAALAGASDTWAVDRLRWFSRDFVRAEVRDGRLLIADLRMGQEPYYVFTHVVAEQGDSGWQPVPTELLPFEYDRSLVFESLRRIWTH